MNQRNNLLSVEQVKSEPEKYIKWQCFNIFISIDKQVFNLSFKPLKEQLIGGSYCYYVNGKYRTKSWINKHCTNVLGFIYND